MTRPQIVALLFFVAIGFGLLSLILFRQGVFVFPGNDDDNLDTKLDTVTIERRDLRTYLDLSGVLEYGDSVQIKPGASGVLTYLASEGSDLTRGSVVLRMYKSVSDEEILVAEHQIALSDASVAQAELALENLKKPATLAQIASSDASVAQAELALENLKKPAT
jgi:hypothetical protein